MWKKNRYVIVISFSKRISLKYIKINLRRMIIYVITITY